MCPNFSFFFGALCCIFALVLLGVQVEKFSDNHHHQVVFKFDIATVRLLWLLLLVFTLFLISSCFCSVTIWSVGDLLEHIRDEIVQSFTPKFGKGIFSTDNEVQHLKECNPDLGWDMPVEEDRWLQPDFEWAENFGVYGYKSHQCGSL